MKEHKGMTSKHGLETPASYNGSRAPSSAELAAPTKVYPGASKLGHDRGPKNLVDGPCNEKSDGLYHK